jgi:hypothetical protein
MTMANRALERFRIGAGLGRSGSRGAVKRGIVIATCDAHAGTWLTDCLRSLAGLPVVLAWNDGERRNAFDAAALFVGWELGLDEWWVLPDTVVVHEPDRLMTLLEDDGQAYALGANFLSCIGKVRRSTIEQVGLPPEPTTKMQAVKFEWRWFKRYAQAERRLITIDRNFADGPEREWRHGRNNMVLRSSLLTKWKGHWTIPMVVDAYGNEPWDGPAPQS